MATLDQIQSKIKSLQQQAEALLAKKSQAVVQQIRDLMAKHGLSIADIESSSGRKAGARKADGVAQAVSSNGKLPAKYRNPKTGETWSGRARPPAWIKDVKDRTKFLIDGAQAIAANGAHATAAIEPKEKRIVPPKYRDPKTGATWSGRGLAPKWIAAAKNRNRFLIEAATPAPDAAEPEASVRKAAVKKATGKAPAKKAANKTSKASARKSAAATDAPALAQGGEAEVSQAAEVQA
ncbi:H-NS histone family protein [Paraburkholderia aspalathi]|nr:H-NS histone family protein [Paraburkholderia aspalathi]